MKMRTNFKIPFKSFVAFSRFFVVSVFLINFFCFNSSAQENVSERIFAESYQESEYDGASTKVNKENGVKDDKSIKNNAIHSEPVKKPSKSTIKAKEVEGVSKDGTVKARGNVELLKDQKAFFADELEYNQRTGEIEAKGNVRVSDRITNEDFLSTESNLNEIKNTGEFKDATVIFDDNSVVTSPKIIKYSEDEYVLTKPKYFICPTRIDLTKDYKDIFEDTSKRSHQLALNSSKVKIDRKKDAIYFKNSIFKIYNIPLFYFPYLKLRIPSDDTKTGFKSIGYVDDKYYKLGVKAPYFVRLSKDKNVLIKPTYFFEYGNYLIETQYNQNLLDSKGEEIGKYRLTASYAHDSDASKIIPVGTRGTRDSLGFNKQNRGHVALTGYSYLPKNWDIHFDGKAIFDKFYLEDYYGDDTDYLASYIQADKIKGRNHLTIKAIGYEELDYYLKETLKTRWESDNSVRIDDPQIVLPIVDWHIESRKSTKFNKVLRNKLFLDGNTTVIARNEGVQYRRVTMEPGFEPTIETPHSVINTSFSIRGDIYDVRENYEDSKYEHGYEKQEGRLIPKFSARWSSPFYRYGRYFDNYLETLVTFVARPYGQEDFEKKIPNEDSESTEITTANIFTDSLYSGYDKVEGGPRLSYGFKGELSNYRLGSLSYTFAQSYRNNDKEEIDILGFDENFSNYVGKLFYKTDSIFDVYYRFRLDETNFEFRSQEVSSSIKVYKFTLNSTYTKFKPKDENNSRIEELDNNLIYRLDDNWSFSAGIKHDLDDPSRILEKRANATFDGGCTKIIFDFEEDRSVIGVAPEKTFTVNFSIKSDLF